MSKKTERRLAKSVLAVICAASLIATCAVYQDGSIGTWNFIALAVFAASAKALDKFINADADA